MLERSPLQTAFLVLLFGSAAALFAAPAEAQAPYQITGQVVSDETGQPVSGVQVSIRGTSIGTLAGDDGRFRLSADLEEGDYTVAFTYLGRRAVTRTVELRPGVGPIDLGTVRMEESAVLLDEIVVVTTGVTSSRREVGNAIESVGGEEVNQAAGAQTIDQALQGRITGAVISENSGQPGGGMSIRLRGTSSITGGAEPLVVVDGVIVDNNNEAMVSISGNATVGSTALSNRLGDIAPADIERIEVLKGAAAAALYGSRANNGVIQIFTRQGQQGAPRISSETSFSVSETPERYDILDYPFAGIGDVFFGPATEIGEPVERFDFQDRMWQTGSGFRQHVSVSGGNEGTTYYMSGSYDTNEGILQGTDDERISLRGRLSQQIGENLELGFGVNIIDLETNFVPEGEQTYGTLTGIIFQPNSFDLTFDPDLGAYPTPPVLGFNPLQVMDEWISEEDVTRVVGNLNATYLVTDDLSFRYTFGVDDYRNEFRRFVSPGSDALTPGGAVQNPIRMSRQINHDLTGNWEIPELGSPDLGLTLSGGFRYTEDHEDVIRAAVEDLPPGLDIVSGATQFATQGITEIRTAGGFVQGRVDWNDRLFVTAGLSGEGSSAFGEDERWQLFPKVNVSWIASDEPFMSDVGTLSTLRLRAAYGETGGQPPGAYLRFDNFVDVGFDGRAGLVASTTAGNPNLEPERQREWEGGFDLGLFDDRALLEVSYYDKLTEDLVLPVPQPPSLGVQTRFENVGVISNTGWEVALSTVNVSRDRLNWRSRLQISTNDNTVEELVTAADTLNVPAGYPSIVAEGQPIGVFYGRFSQRDAEGNEVIDPATGLAVLATNEAGEPLTRIIGDPHPDFTASLANNFTMGERWEFDMLFEGRFGNDVANFTRRITEFFGTDAKVEQEIRSAQGQDVEHVQYTLNGAVISNFERFIEDGSFIKLRELAVRYRLPGAWLAPLGASGGSLRIAGRNLYTWTDYSGLDPEINLFSGNTVARGVDFANTPLPRRFVFSVNLSY